MNGKNYFRAEESKNRKVSLQNVLFPERDFLQIGCGQVSLSVTTSLREIVGREAHGPMWLKITDYS